MVNIHEDMATAAAMTGLNRKGRRRLARETGRIMTRDNAAEIHTRLAAIEPASINEAARTVRVVVSTDAEITRFGGKERLPHTPEVVDLSRTEQGLPLLDNHRRDSVTAQIGKLTDFRLDGGRLEATAHFDKSPLADQIFGMVVRGVVRGVSVGYNVSKYVRSTNEAGETVYTPERWGPVEASVVSVPADQNAGIRGVDNPHAAAIGGIAQAANLPQAWADNQVELGATQEQARAAAVAIQASEQPIHAVRATGAQVGRSFDDPYVRAETVGEALYMREHPEHQPSGPARAYAYQSIPDIARGCMVNAGMNPAGMSTARVIERALSTSDFPLILGNTIGRELRMAYGAAPSGIRAMARQTTAVDFRTRHKIQLGEAPELRRVNEQGEFTQGALAESEETYAVDTFGRIISISRQALINDDLSAFTSLARRFGIAATNFENAFLANLVVSNPNLTDGNPVFDALRSNLAGAGAIPSVATLTAARLAMRLQTGLPGEAETAEFISVTPRFLLVPPKDETTAEQLLATLAATQVTEVNPFSGKLQLATDARLSVDTAWYVAASPDEIDGLEYAHLAGAPGPQTETRAGFEIDGTQVKIRLDFGAGWIDHRGWYKNPGA